MAGLIVFLSTLYTCKHVLINIVSLQPIGYHVASYSDYKDFWPCPCLSVSHSVINGKV